jgi:GT2 family glycosyltransferase
MRKAAGRIAVIMLTVNQREKTARCVSSFLGLADPPEHTVVWDNGSCDGTADYLREKFPRILVHQHPANLGVASGRNAAAKLAINTFNPSHLLFIDNDMMVMPDFTQALLAPFQNGDTKLAQTSAKIKIMRDPARLDAAGGCNVQFWRGQTTPTGNGEIDRGQYDRPMRCIAFGGATLFRADVFQELGGFDPIFDPYGPEDLDFSLRARKAGYHALYVPAAVVLHEGSQTFENKQYTEKYLGNKTRHWFTFMRRHASITEKLAFYMVGGPYTLARMLVRESKKGNVSALKGLVRGLLALK